MKKVHAKSAKDLELKALKQRVKELEHQAMVLEANHILVTRYIREQIELDLEANPNKKVSIAAYIIANGVSLRAYFKVKLYIFKHAEDQVTLTIDQVMRKYMKAEKLQIDPEDEDILREDVINLLKAMRNDSYDPAIYDAILAETNSKKQ